MPNNIRKV